MNTVILALIIGALASISFLMLLCDPIYLSNIPLRNTLSNSKTRLAIRYETKDK
jgi:hypothetical protein